MNDTQAHLDALYEMLMRGRGMDARISNATKAQSCTICRRYIGGEKYYRVRTGVHFSRTTYGNICGTCITKMKEEMDNVAKP